MAMPETAPMEREPGMTTTYTCTVPLELAESVTRTLDNGDVETELDVLELVPQNQVGGAGPFDPSTFADEAVAIFAEEVARGYDVPFVLGHAATDKDGAVGWMTGLRKEGTRLRCTVRLNAAFAEKVRRREHRYASPEIKPYYDQKGVYRGVKLSRVAVTHVPFQKGADGKPIGMFLLSEVPAGHFDPTEPRSNPLPDNAGQESTMTIDEIKAAVASETTGLTAQLSEVTKANATLASQLTDTLAKLSDATTRLAAVEGDVKAVKAGSTPTDPMALSEVKSKLADAEARLAGMERGIKEQSIRKLVSLCEAEFKLTPPMKARLLPGYDADPVKALDDSPLFGGRVAALAEWFANATPAVTATTRTSGSPAQADGTPAEPAEARAKRLGVTVARLSEIEALTADSRG